MLRSTLLISVLALMGVQSAWASSVGQIEGVPIEDSYLVEGAPVVLNGAATRKRAATKTAVTAVYLAERRDTMEAIEAAPGAKRIQLTLMRPIQGAVIARYFVSDFKAVATQEEFKQLINELSFVGSIYASVHEVKKGDVVNMDWVPGKGIHATLNGKVLKSDGGPSYLNNEAMYRLMLRIYVGGAGTPEARDNLLGKSNSMVSAITTKTAAR